MKAVSYYKIRIIIKKVAEIATTILICTNEGDYYLPFTQSSEYYR